MADAAESPCQPFPSWGCWRRVNDGARRCVSYLVSGGCLNFWFPFERARAGGSDGHGCFDATVYLMQPTLLCVPLVPGDQFAWLLLQSAASCRQAGAVISRMTHLKPPVREVKAAIGKADARLLSH